MVETQRLGSNVKRVGKFRGHGFSQCTLHFQKRSIKHDCQAYVVRLPRSLFPAWQPVDFQPQLTIPLWSAPQIGCATRAQLQSFPGSMLSIGYRAMSGRQGERSYRWRRHFACVTTWPQWRPRAFQLGFGLQPGVRFAGYSMRSLWGVLGGSPYRWRSAVEKPVTQKPSEPYTRASVPEENVEALDTSARTRAPGQRKRLAAFPHYDFLEPS